MKEPTRESDVEKYLVDRVEQLGGEVRKVKWIGRNKAPDRLVMLPWGVSSSVGHRTVWVEVKRPGGCRTFPKNAHERGQAREHERMRHLGQHVEVVDSYEGVDRMLLGGLVK